MKTIIDIRLISATQNSDDGLELVAELTDRKTNKSILVNRFICDFELFRVEMEDFKRSINLIKGKK